MNIPSEVRGKVVAITGARSGIAASTASRVPLPGSISARKEVLRQEMRQRLLALDAGRRAAQSARIVERLCARPEWKTARQVLLFAPLPNEPDVDLLWQGDARLRGKTCVYPRVDGLQLQLLAVERLADLTTGRWRLREPPGHRQAPVVAPNDVDLILVPGLAFTADGRRLGRGGGYYDRLLASAGFRAFRVGIAFDFQLLPDLPTEAHDARLDIVLTGASDGPSPGDELDQNDDDRNHQQNVDETADRGAAHQADRP